MSILLFSYNIRSQLLEKSCVLIMLVISARVKCDNAHCHYINNVILSMSPCLLCTSHGTHMYNILLHWTNILWTSIPTSIGNARMVNVYTECSQSPLSLFCTLAQQDNSLHLHAYSSRCTLFARYYTLVHMSFTTKISIDLVIRFIFAIPNFQCCCLLW